MKDVANYSNFESLDIRVGRIIKVEESLAKKPTYKMTIDLGAEIGTKLSIGAFKRYQPEELVGKNVVCIVNLGVRKMGPEISEVFTLGVDQEDGQICCLVPDSDVLPGAVIY